MRRRNLVNEWQIDRHNRQIPLTGMEKWKTVKQIGFNCSHNRQIPLTGMEKSSWAICARLAASGHNRQIPLTGMEKRERSAFGDARAGSRHNRQIPLTGMEKWITTVVNGGLPVTTGKYPSRGWKNLGFLLVGVSARRHNRQIPLTGMENLGHMDHDAPRRVVTTGKYPSRGWKTVPVALRARHARCVTTGKYPSRGWKHHTPLKGCFTCDIVTTGKYPSRGWKLDFGRHFVSSRVGVTTGKYPSRGWKPLCAPQAPRWSRPSQQANTPHGDGNGKVSCCTSLC